MQVQHHNHYMQVKLDEGTRPKETSTEKIIIVNPRNHAMVSLEQHKYPLILGNKKNSVDFTTTVSDGIHH
jgi:hypothetical protein